MGASLTAVPPPLTHGDLRARFEKYGELRDVYMPKVRGGLRCTVPSLSGLSAATRRSDTCCGCETTPEYHHLTMFLAPAPFHSPAPPFGGLRPWHHDYRTTTVSRGEGGQVSRQ